MAIKKSKNVPDPTTKVNYGEDSKHEARHPHLSGLRQDVYYFIQHNPNSTRRDVAKGLGLPNNVATARIKELIDEGFLWEPPNIRKENSSGVRARVLRVTDRREGGHALDRVRVEVELTIDCNGVYGATAHVVGAPLQAKNAFPILKKRITVTAPHPDTYKSSVQKNDVTPISRYELQSGQGDILEGEVLPPDT